MISSTIQVCLQPKEKRMEKGEEFMTTSCCAGYNELVDKHIPEMKSFRSHIF